MKAAGLETVPERVGGDATLVLCAGSVVHAVGLLQGERIEDVLRCLAVPLQGEYGQEILKCTQTLATYPQVDA